MKKTASVSLCPVRGHTPKKSLSTGYQLFEEKIGFLLPFVFCFVPAFWGILRVLYRLLTRQLADKKKD